MHLASDNKLELLLINQNEKKKHSLNHHKINRNSQGLLKELGHSSSGENKTCIYYECSGISDMKRQERGLA